MRKILFLLQDTSWRVRGRLIANPPRPLNFQTVLFVCKGNICRSAFAEKYACLVMKGKGREDLRIFSAGLEVGKENPPPEMAVQAASRLGVDLGSHRSRPLDRPKAIAADLIVVMEPWQRERVCREFGIPRGKVYLLSLFGGGREQGYSRYNIQDPYGQSLEAFLSCFRLISTAVDQMLRPH